jgi:translation initiation factor 2B subunit (eIF-2B alpha/beta/delta family)
MNKKIPPRLKQLLNNKKLGSSELVRELNNFFISIRNDKNKILEATKLVKLKLGHFVAINSYLNELKPYLKKKQKEDLIDFMKGYSKTENDSVRLIFKKIYPELKDIQSIITLSRSGTVLAILKSLYQKNKKIKVVVCESRPKFEGRLLAKELAGTGIKVELITDSMMGLFTQNIDAAIVGADVVLRNGDVVNKVGSKLLAMLCREYKKPFYVVTRKSKYSMKKIFTPKKENAHEVWNKKARNLSVSNYYFEEIEKKLITKIFTD